MSTESYREMFENCYAGLSRGEPEALWSILHDDIEWTLIGGTFVSGTYRGRAEITEAIVGNILSRLGAPPVLKVKRVIADGNSAAVEAVGHCVTADGQDYDNTYCWVCDFQDGKVIRLVEYLDTALLNATFAA